MAASSASRRRCFKRRSGPRSSTRTSRRGLKPSSSAPSPASRSADQHYSELAHDLANPERVQPFFEEDTPLIERNPLGFYKAGFFILLALVIWMALKLLATR